MAEIVNLARVRKAVAKQADRQRADENAVRFGRTKAERALIAARAAKAQRDLDGAKLEGAKLEGPKLDGTPHA